MAEKASASEGIVAKELRGEVAKGNHIKPLESFRNL
jgi:hypothetical protein